MEINTHGNAGTSNLLAHTLHTKTPKNVVTEENQMDGRTDILGACAHDYIIDRITYADTSEPIYFFKHMNEVCTSIELSVC